MLKIILKFVFAFGLIYWLYQKGTIDFSMVTKSFAYPLNWVICIALVGGQSLCNVYRWKILLEVKNEEKLPMLPMIKLTWIGMFFSSILPGAVTGDLIKVVYAKDLSPKINKTFLVTSALMDRVLGLMGLLFSLGIFSLISYNELTAISKELTYLIHMNFLIFAGMLAAILCLILPQGMKEVLKKFALKIPVLNRTIIKTLDQVWLIGQNRKVVFKCIGLSVVAQTGVILAFYIISSPFYDNHIPIKYAFTFIPVGMMAIAIPVAPAGLGVGHAIFVWLFKLFGVSGGASLFNLYFLAYVSINLLGFIPYVFGSGKRHSLKETEEFAS